MSDEKSELTGDQINAVLAWRDAERARHAAVNTYNAKLASDRARGEFPPRVAPEYQAMTVANRAEAHLRDAMFLRLRAALNPTAEEG